MIWLSIALLSISITGLQIQQEKIPCDNYNNRDIAITWYQYESLANQMSNKRYQWTSWNLDMIATFMCEAHFNTWAVGSLGEKWVCQLLPNRTNNVWINDPRRQNRERQSQMCMEKYLAVPKPARIRSCYKQREKYKKYIYFLNKCNVKEQETYTQQEKIIKES